MFCELRVGVGSRVLRVLGRGGGEGRVIGRVSILIAAAVESETFCVCRPVGFRLEHGRSKVYKNLSLTLE
jgi:hypothetical protein